MCELGVRCCFIRVKMASILKSYSSSAFLSYLLLSDGYLYLFVFPLKIDCSIDCPFQSNIRVNGIYIKTCSNSVFFSLTDCLMVTYTSFVVPP